MSSEQLLPEAKLSAHQAVCSSSRSIAWDKNLVRDPNQGLIPVQGLSEQLGAAGYLKQRLARAQERGLNLTPGDGPDSRYATCCLSEVILPPDFSKATIKALPSLLFPEAELKRHATSGQRSMPLDARRSVSKLSSLPSSNSWHLLCNVTVKRWIVQRLLLQDVVEARNMVVPQHRRQRRSGSAVSSHYLTSRRCCI